MEATQLSLTFRPLEVGDLFLLGAWLNRPHVRQFHQKQPASLSEVEARYLPRIRGEAPARCHVALYAERPIGMAQCGPVASDPDFASATGAVQGIGVDFFIGEAEMQGRNLGRIMLRRYVRNVAFALFPAETTCLVAIDAENRAAIACARAAGFNPLRTVVDGGALRDVLQLRKP